MENTCKIALVYMYKERLNEFEPRLSPLTACRWHIKANPGVKLMITIEKMDIEEEDPTDSPHCNERKSF